MSDDDITPGGVWSAYWRWAGPVTGMAIVTVLLGALVLLVGWQVGGWFQVQGAARQTRVIEHGIGYQTAKTDDLNQQIANVLNVTTSMIGMSGPEYAGLHAQRLGDARLACADASQIDTIPADQAGWVAANCTDGTLNPASPLLTTQGS